jgi:hypothetical protein
MPDVLQARCVRLQAGGEKRCILEYKSADVAKKQVGTESSLVGSIFVSDKRHISDKAGNMLRRPGLHLCERGGVRNILYLQLPVLKIL